MAQQEKRVHENEQNIGYTPKKHLTQRTWPESLKKKRLSVWGPGKSHKQEYVVVCSCTMSDHAKHHDRNARQGRQVTKMAQQAQCNCKKVNHFFPLEDVNEGLLTLVCLWPNCRPPVFIGSSLLANITSSKTHSERRWNPGVDSASAQASTSRFKAFRAPDVWLRDWPAHPAASHFAGLHFWTSPEVFHLAEQGKASPNPERFCEHPSIHRLLHQAVSDWILSQLRQPSKQLAKDVVRETFPYSYPRTKNKKTRSVRHTRRPIIDSIFVTSFAEQISSFCSCSIIACWGAATACAKNLANSRRNTPFQGPAQPGAVKPIMQTSSRPWDILTELTSTAGCAERFMFTFYGEVSFEQITVWVRWCPSVVFWPFVCRI